MFSKFSNFSGPISSFVIQNNLSNLILSLDAGNTASYSGTGSIWHDLSGNNNNFGLINSPIFENNSIYFNSNYNQYATASDLGNLNKFTIDTWFNLKSLPATGSNPQIITNIYDSDHNYINFTIGFLNSPDILGNNWNSQILGGFFSGFDTFWKFTGGFTPSLNTWYNTALTYDTNNLKLYLNGHIYSSVSCNATALSSNLGVYVGRRWDNPEFIDADISIVRIWDNALNASQILNNFNASKYRFLNAYRYFKIVITDIKNINEQGDSGCCQMSNFIIRLNGSNISWNNSAVASNPNGYTGGGEGPENLLDNNVNTKWCDQNFSNSQTSYIYIDNVEPVQFDSYYYTTANDVPGRDPITWNLYVSNDNSTWNLIDSRTNEIITDTREVSTQFFNIM